MKTYKIWIEVEEIDREENSFNTLEEYTEAAGGEFDTLEEALEVREKIINSF